MFQSISPGLVKSSLYRALGEAFEEFVYKKYPSMQPEDIASAVEFILSTPPHVLVTYLIVDSNPVKLLGY